MARLTKDMKLAFVNAVLADIIDGGTEEKLINVARKAYMGTLPAAITAIHQDEATKGYVNVHMITFFATEDGEYEWHARRATVANIPYSQIEKGLTDKELREQFPEVKAAWEAWRDFTIGKDELQRKLFNVAEICSSTQKLVAALPELATYVPDNVVVNTAGVPQTNDIAVLLSTLGWKEK